MPASKNLVTSVAQSVFSERALGQNVLRREGAAKLCGKACYVDDLPRNDVWVGGTVRADVPHGRLLGIRYDQGFDWSRVVVVTAADIPGENVVPVVMRDQPALTDSIIRYRGEPVALIAAPDEETLQQALDSVTLETAPLEPVFEIDAALTAKVLVYGRRAEEVVRFALQNQADLIVLRSHRYDPQTATFLVGTLSHQIAALAQCAALLVK